MFAPLRSLDLVSRKALALAALAFAVLAFLLWPAFAFAQPLVHNVRVMGGTGVDVLQPAPAAQVADFFWGTVFPFILTGLSVAFGWLGKVLIQWVHSKAESSKAFAAVEKLTIIAINEVANAEATLRPLVAKAMEDGSMSAEEGAELRRIVLERIKTSAGPALLSAVQSQVAGNIEGLIGGLLERSVTKLAAEAAPPAVVAVASPPAP